MPHYLVSKTAKILAIAVLTGGAFIAGCSVAAQPHMFNALQALQNARHELDVAAANKGGHRVRAIGLVDQAIDQVQAGIDAGR